MEKQDDKAARVQIPPEPHQPSKVPTWTVEELTTLYRHATPLERVFILLGLNCGFSVADFGSLRLDEILLHQQQDQSWIRRVRPMSRTYGEWLLWPHTVAAIEWAVERRKTQPGFAPDAILMVSQHGRPMIDDATGDCTSRIKRLWHECLLKRVKSILGKKDFRTLPPKSLRTTSGNMVAAIADAEAVAAFLGRRPAFDSQQVFEAIEKMGQRLQPLWEAVPEPFPARRAEDGESD